VGFAKLDDQLAGSSLLVQGGLELVGFWALLLSMKDREGRIYESVPMLARRCATTNEKVRALLEVLASPDPDSRTPDHEGRRVIIEREPRWCIVILNHFRYLERDRTGADRAKRYRERHGASRVTGVTGVTEGVTRHVPYLSSIPSSLGEKGVRGEEGAPATAYRPPGPANPLVAGRRVELERECLALVTEVAGLTGEDPVDVIAAASGYKGAATTKLNPATMSDDRLANTVRDLRADAAALRAKGAKSGTAAS
jgi:hypothetical protein